MRLAEFLKSLSVTTLFFAPLAGHAQVASGQSFRLASACDTKKVMSISNNSLSDNARVILQTQNLNNSSQVFKFESYSAGYKITNARSGKTLNIANASTKSKAALEQYKFTGVQSEVFKISKTSDGYYRLQNSNSSLYVNLVNASTAEGNLFEQYTDTTACAEKFKLVAVSTAPSPTPVPSPSATPKPPSPTPSPTPREPASVRDPLKQPFASTSIWNMPIGSGAQFVPANLGENLNPQNNIWAPFPGYDEERIFMTPTAPLTPVYYNSAAWTGANRCTISGSVRISVPMPSSYVVPTGNGNNSAVFLMADKRTLVSMQPLARCTAGGPATSYAFNGSEDLYGEGRSGSHGGSGLSTLGGAIRLGELRPGQQGPRHALKMALYAKGALFKCATRAECYRWPAYTGDSYAVGWYGTVTNNQNKAMKMGSLLALPPSVSIGNLGLETEPGRQIAWTLQNYGVYIVDDTYGAPGVLLNVENGAAGSKLAEFQQDYGYAFIQKVNAPNAWLRDIKRLMALLEVVNNNSATSIGGGGTPRQPLAAPISP